MGSDPLLVGCPAGGSPLWASPGWAAPLGDTTNTLCWWRDATTHWPFGPRWEETKAKAKGRERPVMVTWSTAVLQKRTEKGAKERLLGQKARALIQKAGRENIPHRTAGGMLRARHRRWPPTPYLVGKAQALPPGIEVPRAEEGRSDTGRSCTPKQRQGSRKPGRSGGATGGCRHQPGRSSSAGGSGQGGGNENSFRQLF